jgi:hypothetical protein
MWKYITLLVFLLSCASTKEECRKELDIFCQLEIGEARKICYQMNKAKLSAKCQRYFTEKGNKK